MAVISANFVQELYGNDPFIFALASTVQSYINKGFPNFPASMAEDVMQVGICAMYEAKDAWLGKEWDKRQLDLFDFIDAENFVTPQMMAYCYKVVNGTVAKFFKDNNSIVSYTPHRMHQFAKLKKWEKDHDIELDKITITDDIIDELCDYLTVKHLENPLFDYLVYKASSVASMDKVIDNGEDSQQTLGDIIPTPEGISEGVKQTALENILIQLFEMGDLTPEEQLAVALHEKLEFLTGKICKNNKEISEIMGWSFEKIRTVFLSPGIEKLKLAAEDMMWETGLNLEEIIEEECKKVMMFA